jgi:hypothetical protein
MRKAVRGGCLAPVAAVEGGEWVLVKTMMKNSEALFDMFTPPKALPKKPTADDKRRAAHKMIR